MEDIALTISGFEIAYIGFTLGVGIKVAFLLIDTLYRILGDIIKDLKDN